MTPLVAAARPAPSDSTEAAADRRAALRAGIVRLARAEIGTPYRHQGRQPGVGLDCAGLVLVIAHRLALTGWDITNYPRLPRGDRLIALAAEAGFVERTAVRPGDVVCLRLVEHPQHLAIASPCGIIHSCMNRGRVVEHRMDAAWRRRIVSVFAYPGLDD